MERYGELAGEIICCYATAFAQANQSLIAEQRAQLITLRTEMMDGMSYPSGAYLYSQPIATPEISNTDFLFAVP